MKPIVVAFYTMDTGYQELAHKLISTIKQFNLLCDIWPIKNKGSWTANCQYKAEFLLEMVKRNKGKTLLYIDVDAEIKQYPTFADTFKGDIAVHYLDDKELLSGTILLNANERTEQLCEYWVRLCKRDTQMWDQKALEIVLAKYGDFLQLKIEKLPPTYVQIFDTMAGVGEPVIEHYQASRTLKTQIETPIDRPAMVWGNIRLRRDDDGAYWIVRSNREAEEYMDKHYIRVKNELRWIPKTTSVAIEPFKDKHLGTQGYIIGKGPSLDKLTEANFLPDVPIFCLNESVKKIESLKIENPIYVIQQDARLREECWPNRGWLFTSLLCASWYVTHPRRIIYDPRAFVLQDNSLSVLVAEKLAKFMGVTNLILYGFDSCTNGQLEYAESVGHSATQGGDLDRFKKHKSLIEISFRNDDMPFEFLEPIVIPQSGSSSDDTLQPSEDNH